MLSGNIPDLICVSSYGDERPLFVVESQKVSSI